MLCLIMGKEFLNYSALDSILPGGVEMARSHSMLAVEIGVALTVTAVMFSMFSISQPKAAWIKVFNLWISLSRHSSRRSSSQNSTIGFM